MAEQEWQASISGRLDSVEGKLSTLEVQTAVGLVDRHNVEKRLASIEETLRWLVKLIIGALISAALVFTVSGGFAGFPGA